MKLRRLAVALAGLAASLAASAFTPTPNQAANQYRPYPVDSLTVLPAPPAGYEPFHMEHYGRHGSRWLITDDNFNVTVDQLSKAQRNGKLTPKGAQVLEIVKQVQADAKGRRGELTGLGAEQHKGIAQRMVKHFPQIFAAPGVPIDARSTVVIRCILSMLNEVEALAVANPSAIITTDASEADMYYMNQHDPEKNEAVSHAKDTALKEFRAQRPDGLRWLRELVDDEQFIADSLNTDQLGYEMFTTAVSLGNHGNRYPDLVAMIYTPEEVAQRWEQNNADWFLNGAMSPLTDFKAPRGQRNLANNMLASADTTITSLTPSANLRFGHETMVLSLACLMDLDGYGTPYASLDELAEKWHAFDIFPMGCNIQMVFYRPSDRNPANLTEDNVLVQVLLNETPRKVGILPAQESTFYSWPAFKKALQERAR